MYRKRVEEILGSIGSTINGPNTWDVQVHNDGFYKRVITEGTMGIGESYMDGWWDCERLDILESKLGRPDSPVVRLGKAKILATGLVGVITNPQTLFKARRNAHAHMILE